MPWKVIKTEQLAKELGVDIETIKAKHELIRKIKKIRQDNNLTQEDLAKLINKTQSYVAKVESGLGTSNFSFDVLLGILKTLGYDYKITTKKVSSPGVLAA